VNDLPESIGTIARQSAAAAAADDAVELQSSAHIDDVVMPCTDDTRPSRLPLATADCIDTVELVSTRSATRAPQSYHRHVHVVVKLQLHGSSFLVASYRACRATSPRSACHARLSESVGRRSAAVYSAVRVSCRSPNTTSPTRATCCGHLR